MQRRQFHRHLGALGLLALGGCGFAPRQALSMPFNTLALNGFKPQSTMAQELKVLINTSASTRVIEELTRADVILDALSDVQERGRGGQTAAGQIRSLNLVYRFKFRLRTLSGKELIGPSELAAARSLSYNESQALAKESEEASLFHYMQTDLADQVMRRLAAVKVT